MKQSELKSRLLPEWDRWLQGQKIGARRPTARDTLKFFCELEDSRSPLLEFRAAGRDKWQVIHAWLLGEGRVSDPVPLTRSPPRRPGRAGSRLGGKRRS